MAGNETNGFDTCIQFTEQFFNQFLGTTFNSVDGSGQNLVAHLLSEIGLGLLASEFTVDILMDRPTDIPLPAGAAENLIDIRIGLPSVDFRFVVGVMVDRSDPDSDGIVLDFGHQLAYAEIAVLGFSITETILRDAVANIFGAMTILAIPLPGGRSSTEAGNIIRADLKVIDDTSSADRDAIAVCFTFGGGTPGNLNNFTQSFIASGEPGGMGFNFTWLCRILSPLIANSLGIAESDFTNCVLTRSVTIDAEEDVQLTALSLTLQDGFIQVNAAISKSGFCYTATGSVTARLRMEIEGGRLIVQTEIDDPDINIDIPWYCWLGAVVVGGIVLGIIGAIIGPLILHIATNAVEGAVENVASSITDALNEITPDANVGVPGLEFVFTRVFIDDIVIRTNFIIKDTAPVRSSGTLRVPNNSYIDFDSATVGGENLSSPDVHFTGSGQSRKLRTICISSLARTSSGSFGSITQYNTYGYSYETGSVISMAELAMVNPIGALFGDKYIELKRVYALKTNENRYVIFYVNRVEDDYIDVHYKVWDNGIRTLGITGQFYSEHYKLPVGKNAEFVPSKLHTALSAKNEVLNNHDRFLAADDVRKVTVRKLDVNELVRTGISHEASTMAMLETAPAIQRDNFIFSKMALADKRIGDWIEMVAWRKKAKGTFIAQNSGMRGPVTYTWSINNQKLEGEHGTVIVAGKEISFTQRTNRITLEITRMVAFTFELKVIAIDASTEIITKIRCMNFDPDALKPLRVVPTFEMYKKKYMETWGIVEVATGKVNIDLGQFAENTAVLTHR